jgi:polysaccharide chain length determinant protein (PEP-CTERM system associated)
MNNLSNHLRAIRRRWAVAVIIAATMMAVSVPVALGLPNLYSAKASLLVDQLPDTIAQMGTFSQLDGRLQAIKQEALSRHRLTELIERHDLYPKLRQRGALNDVIAQVQKDVRVDILSTTRADGRAVAFTVSYLGNDPQKVSDVANQFAQFYVEKNGDLRSRQATRSAEILKTELDAARRRLDGHEQKLIAFSTKNVETLPQQAQTTLARYGQLTAQLQMNTATQTSLMAQRDTLENQIAGLSTLQTTTEVTDPSMKLALAEKELSALFLTGLGDNHPRVKEKRDQIASLRAEVAAKATNGDDGSSGVSQVSTLQAQLASIDARLATLKQNIDEIHKEMKSAEVVLKQTPVRNLEFEQISRDIQSAREVHDQLQRRYQEALLTERAEEGRSGEEFQILDPALPATGAAAPNRMLLLVGSVLFALAMGLGCVLLLERLDGSFRSVDELRAFTHVPILTTIPRIVTSRDRVRRLIVSCVAGIGVAAALWFVSANLFRMAQTAEGITRILARFG